MDVRPIESERDLQAVNRVNVLAWRAAYDGILPDSVLEDRSVGISSREAAGRFERIQDATGCFLVAVDDTDQIRGYVWLRWGEDTKDFVDDEEAGLKEIYVEPDYWGAGVGTRLLERALAELPAAIEAVRLEMLSGNDVAEGFYESHGFERVDSSTFELHGEAYLTAVYEKRR